MLSLLLCALCWTSWAALQVGDEELRLTVAEDGRWPSLTVRGTELVAEGQTGGLSLYDVGERRGPVSLRGRCETTGDGVRVLYDGGELDTQVSCELRRSARHTIVLQVTVDDRRGADRGLILEVGLPLRGAGWRWWDDPDTSRPIAPGGQYSNLVRLRELPGLPEFDSAANLADFGSYSCYPVAAVTGPAGLGLAKPPRAASLFRLGADGTRGTVYCAFDFALSPDTKRPGHAEFTLALFPLDPTQGFRGALAELYDLWPQDFASRVPMYGGWMPFVPLSRIANVDEFGFAYQEGAANPHFDDLLGVSSFIYFHCAGEFADLPGYTRGQPLPPYEQQLAELNRLMERRTGQKDLWTITGIQRPEGRVEIRPEAVYGHIFSQACMDPDLPFGRFMVDSLVTAVTRDPAPIGVDGCYYDGLAVGLDYSREHFRVADHPLLWDANLQRPVAYNFFASLEWAERIADAIHPLGKLTMLNDSSVSSFPFVFPFIDVLGAEGGWVDSDAAMIRIRAYAHHKPYCTLLKTDYRQAPQAKIESYMRRCLAFGHLFGFFDISPSGANPGSSYWEHPEWYDRDRELFRRYMPLCVELNRAGWEPVPLAATATAGAALERFGGGRDGTHGDLVYFTLRRIPEDTDERVQVQLSPDLHCLAASEACVVDLLTGETQALEGNTFTAHVPPGEVGVYAVGGRAAQVRQCLERVREVVASRERYLTALTGSLSALGAWASYMTGATRDHEVAHSGRASLRASLADPTQSAGASQALSLNQEQPEELIVRAASRAQDVSGQADAGYSIYVDCYYHDGGKLYGQIIPFTPGTHDWETGELVIRPTSTIAQVIVYCMFRGHTGTVWFDDVSLCRASAPDVNLLRDGGFEPPATPLDDPLVARISTVLGETRARVLEDGPGVPETAALPAAVGELAELLDTVGGAALGPDGERAYRDLVQTHGLLVLAQRLAQGHFLPRMWPPRLTPPYPLEQPRATPPAPRTVDATAPTGVPVGTRVSVDSNYEDYNPRPLIDGQINPQTADWTQVAWASADGPTEHWIRLDLPEPVQARGVVLHWARDAGVYYNSQQVVIETLEGETWRPVPQTRIETTPERMTVRFQPTALRCLRVRQPVGGGAPVRPNIMWVSEIALLTE